MWEQRWSAYRFKSPYQKQACEVHAKYKLCVHQCDKVVSHILPLYQHMQKCHEGVIQLHNHAMKVNQEIFSDNIVITKINSLKTKITKQIVTCEKKHNLFHFICEKCCKRYSNDTKLFPHMTLYLTPSRASKFVRIRLL